MNGCIGWVGWRSVQCLETWNWPIICVDRLLGWCKWRKTDLEKWLGFFIAERCPVTVYYVKLPCEAIFFIAERCPVRVYVKLPCEAIFFIAERCPVRVYVKLPCEAIFFIAERCPVTILNSVSYLGLVIIHSKAGLGIPRINCFAWTVKLTLVDICFRTFIAYIRVNLSRIRDNLLCIYAVISRIYALIIVYIYTRKLTRIYVLIYRIYAIIARIYAIIARIYAIIARIYAIIIAYICDNLRVSLDQFWQVWATVITPTLKLEIHVLSCICVGCCRIQETENARCSSIYTPWPLVSHRTPYWGCCCYPRNIWLSWTSCMREA